jgi:hypothetical protein
MKMKFPLILGSAITAGIYVSSCSGSGAAGSGDVDTLQLKGELLIPYDNLLAPEQLLASSDRIYVINQRSVDTMISEFATDGKFVKNFLPKGQGPDETPFIWCPHYDANSDVITFSKDKNLMGVTSLKSDKPALTPVFEFDSELPGNEDFTPGFDKWLFANGSILSGNQANGKFFAEIGADGVVRGYAVDFIPESEFGKGAPDYLKYNFTRPNGEPSPDGKHAAWVMGQADMMVFATAEKDSIRFVTKYVAPPSGIQFKIFDNYSTFEFAPDHKTYYTSSPALSDKAVYVQYVGESADEFRTKMQQASEGEIEMPQSIVRVYDFEGNLCHVLRLDKGYGNIAVNPENTKLYLLAETADDGLAVYSYDISQLN